MVLVNFVGAFTAINQNVEMPELTLEPDSTGGENKKKSLSLTLQWYSLFSFEKICVVCVYVLLIFCKRKIAKQNFLKGIFFFDRKRKKN
jgi:hypothetical protein